LKIYSPQKQQKEFVFKMKLKPDCVRDVLIFLEENLVYNEKHTTIGANSVRIVSIDWSKVYNDKALNESYLVEDIQYAIQKLHEAEFITANPQIGAFQ
jgi:hypothetical protein